jgi:hypothetical protein
MELEGHIFINARTEKLLNQRILIIQIASYSDELVLNKIRKQIKLQHLVLNETPQMPIARLHMLARSLILRHESQLPLA